MRIGIKHMTFIGLVECVNPLAKQKVLKPPGATTASYSPRSPPGLAAVAMPKGAISYFIKFLPKNWSK